MTAQATCHQIQLGAERLLSVLEIIDEIEKTTGLRRHYSGVARWMTHGVRGIRLPFVRVGAQRYSTRAALTKWLAATSAEVS